MLHYLLLGTFCVSQSSINAQCNFYEDYSSDTSWTQVGSEVEIRNGKVQFVNGAKCREFQKRVYRPLGRTLNESDCWEASFEFTPISVGVKNNLPYAGHIVLGVTAGTNSFHFDCSDPPCTGHNKGVQDAVLVVFAAKNPPNGDLYFTIHTIDSTNEITSQKIVSMPLGSTHFIKLEKTKANQAQLSIYSDSSFTNHLPGSPVLFSYQGSVDALTHVQHGNTIRGESRRQLTGSVDNLCMKWKDPFPAHVKPNLPSDTLICAGDSVNLSAGMGSQFDYLWNTGSTDSMITIDREGVYSVIVSNGCTQIFDTITVLVIPKLENQLEDISFCQGQRSPLSYRAVYASYLWSTGDTSSTIYPNQTGLYSVEVTNACEIIYDEAYVEIIDCDCNITLPNVFTPNNDGENDFFKAVEIGTECIISLSVFNRWGRLVFESTDNDFMWDGGDVADGVYYWIVNYTDPLGVSHTENGTVTITR